MKNFEAKLETLKQETMIAIASKLLEIGCPKDKFIKLIDFEIDAHDDVVQGVGYDDSLTLTLILRMEDELGTYTQALSDFKAEVIAEVADQLMDITDVDTRPFSDYE
jgi:hypothetical protein